MEVMHLKIIPNETELWVHLKDGEAKVYDVSLPSSHDADCRKRPVKTLQNVVYVNMYSQVGLYLGRMKRGEILRVEQLVRNTRSIDVWLRRL